MPKKYKVEIKQTDTYIIDVLAESEEQAKEQATPMWNIVCEKININEYNELIDALNTIDEQAENGAYEYEEQEERAKAYYIVSSFIDRVASREKSAFVNMYCENCNEGETAKAGTTALKCTGCDNEMILI